MRPAYATTGWRHVGVIILVAALFIVSGMLAHLPSLPNAFVIPIYAPAGVALASVLLWGRRIWPGIFVGEFAIATWSVSHTVGVFPLSVLLPESALIAAGSVAQALLGAYLVQRLIGTWYPFTRARSVMLFALLAGFVSCLVNATIGAVMLNATGEISWRQIDTMWVSWWLGDATGVVIVTPLMLAAFAGSVQRAPRPRLAEIILFLLLVAVDIVLFLSPRQYSNLHILPVLPLIVWAAVRFDLLVTATLVLLIAMLAVWNIAHGRGVFMNASPFGMVLFIELLLCTIAITALLLHATIRERCDAQEEVERLNRSLEARVRERTSQLDAANASLRESESRYTDIARSIPGIVYQFVLRKDDHSFTFPYLSARAAEFLGISVDTLQNDALALYRTIAPEDVARITEAVETSACDMTQFDMAYQVMTDGQSGRWLRWISTPMSLPNGDVLWNGVAIDITEQVNGEERLRMSEARYRQLFTSMTEGFALHEIIRDDAGNPIDYRYLDVNPAFERLTGLPRERVIGHRVREVLPELESYWIETFGRVAITGEPATIEQEVHELGRIYTAYAYQVQPGQFAVVFFDVTDRQRAAIALRESEERYRLSFEEAPIGFIHIGLDGCLLHANQRFADIVGVPPASLTGKPIGTLTESEDLIADALNKDRLLRGETHRYTTEIRLCRPGGSNVWTEFSVAVLRDEYGDPLYFIAAVSDISYRKRIESVIAALSSTTRTGQAFFEQMIELLCETLNTDLAFVGEYVPNAAEGQVQTVAVCTPGPLAPSFRYDLTQTPCDRVMTEGVCVYPTEVHQEFPQDELLQTSKIQGYAGVRLTDSHQHPIGILVALFRTPIFDPAFVETVILLFAARTGAEMERTHAEQALETERALVSTAIEILPFPILFENPHGETFRMNSAVRTLLKAHKNGKVLTRHDMQLFTSDTHQEIPYEEWPENRALRGEVVMAEEFILGLPDGKQYPILAQAAPIYVENTLVAAVVAFQDISRLKAADQAKDQFLMVLSHELKTPLTSILGWARSAMKMPDSTPRALEIIIRNAEEQQRILQDLLEISRIVAGRLSLEMAPVDLWAVAQHSVDSHLPDAETRGIELSAELPDLPLPVMGDAVRLLQIINNLLDNALKFTGRGGTVRVCGRREDNWAVIDVQDTGRGFPSQVVPDLFKPFTQLERTETTGGLGLGLALVNGLTRLHNGQVSAASPGLGKGSIFSIRIPLLHEEPNG